MQVSEIDQLIRQNLKEVEVSIMTNLRCQLEETQSLRKFDPRDKQHVSNEALNARAQVYGIWFVAARIAEKAEL